MKDNGRMITQTDLADTGRRKAHCISDIGKMTYKRVMEEKKCLINQFSKENFLMEPKMDQEFINSLTGLNIMVNLGTIFLTDKEHLNGQIKNNIQDNGKITKCTALDNLLGLMAVCIPVITKTMLSKVRANLPGQM